MSDAEMVAVADKPNGPGSTEEGRAPLFFHHHPGLTQTLGMVLALACVELVVVHIVLAAMWSAKAALILSLLSGAGVIWIVTTIRAIRRLPVLVRDDRLLLRLGKLQAVEVARANVVAVRLEPVSDETRRRDVLRLTLIERPNVMIALDEPVRAGRRMVRSVGLKLADPAAFAAAIEAQRSA